MNAIYSIHSLYEYQTKLKQTEIIFFFMSLPLDVHFTETNDNTICVPVMTINIDLKTAQVLVASIGFQ